MKIAPTNLMVNFCNSIARGARSAGTELYAHSFSHVRECLRNFVLFGAAVRIEELTIEREELTQQIEFLRTANEDLNIALEASEESEQGLRLTNEYLMKEKTRLMALNADLTQRLNNLTPEQRLAVEQEKEALQALAAAVVEENRRLDLLAKRAWNNVGQKALPASVPPPYCLN